MSGIEAKQKTLKKIREALSHTVPLPFPQSEGGQSPFEHFADEGEVAFARNFGGLNGKFSYCANLSEAGAVLRALFAERDWSRIYWENAEPVSILRNRNEHHEELSSCDAAVTSCECLVARTGSLVLSSFHGGRASSVYCPIHICLAFSDQVVPDLRDALSLLRKKYGDKMPSFISFASGPSRTADIEKTLVVGVHGPKEVFCLLVDSRQ